MFCIWNVVRGWWLILGLGGCFLRVDIWGLGAEGAWFSG